jgi:adenine phosphoribosyltransferase
MIMNSVSIETVKSAIRNVPDFPLPGIQFKDITTALKQPELFKYVVDYFADLLKNEGITKVVSIESRGFILGGALAYHLGAGFVPVRKSGKLPADTYRKEYQLEYGTDCLEIHTDALQEHDIVLIHDDLLATGGTAIATHDLISNFHVKKIIFCFFCDLSFLSGRARLNKIAPVYSMINF